MVFKFCYVSRYFNEKNRIFMYFIYLDKLVKISFIRLMLNTWRIALDRQFLKCTIKQHAEYRKM